MPQISIIIPVYNTEKFLRPCLDSILKQTFADWEAILVDDGSKDQSGAICDEYSARDQRFVVVHKQNEGVAKARIVAFEHSKGDMITFIDSDDYVSPDYLEKLATPIFEEDADMVSCDYEYVENGQRIIPPARLNGTWEDEQIKEFISNSYFHDKTTKGYGMTIFLCTKMIKRNLVQVGLKQGEGMWYAEDQIGVFYMLLHCKKLVLLSDRLYFYVQHEEQAMKKYNYSLWENLIMLMEKYQNMDKDNIAESGRMYITWWHIRRTILVKMRKANISPLLFCTHLSKMRSSPYMKQYFESVDLNFSKKDKILYWFLKNRHFMLLYFLLKIKI